MAVRKPRAGSLSFDVCKRNVLGKLDKSPKGSIDAPILSLVGAINASLDYVTTSTCSGRISIFSTPDATAARAPGRWLLVSHALIEPGELERALRADALAAAVADGLSSVMIKVEAAILHVQCRSVDAAKSMLRVAIGHGFRESGIVLSASKKVMLAVRTTSNMMEAPLVRAGCLTVDGAHLAHLHAEANRRLAANLQMLERFERAFHAELGGSASAAPSATAHSELLADGLVGSPPPQGVARRACWLACQLLVVWRCALASLARAAVSQVAEAAWLSLEIASEAVASPPADLAPAAPAR
jgi:tRNA wybutosine-synthesizing protein 3